ncbi:methyltransferase [Streptomyces sp. M10(2022)]
MHRYRRVGHRRGGRGAGHVTAVDVSRRATLATRFNARIRGLPVRVEHRDAMTFHAARQFDVILANPPYVPSPRRDLPGADRTGHGTPRVTDGPCSIRCASTPSGCFPAAACC